MSIYLKKVDYEDIDKEYEAIINIPENENGLVNKYYNVTKELTCPVLIIQGKKDNIVPLSSARHVYNTVLSKTKKIVYVENLTHDVFYGERAPEIFKIVLDFLKNNDSGEYNI